MESIGNNGSCNNEDLRKKRDNREALDGDYSSTSKEKPKKRHAQTSAASVAQSPSAEGAPNSSATVDEREPLDSKKPPAEGADDTNAVTASSLEEVSPKAIASSSTTRHQPPVSVGARGSWDLESALHALVRAGGEGCKEPLTGDKWLTFRVGHAGDATTLDALYRKSISSLPHTCSQGSTSKSCSASNVEDPSNSLEVWLAEGLGDEDTPPSLYAILAEIQSEDDALSANKPSALGAAALLTLAWEESVKVLRVEWLYIDRENQASEQVKRRLWLRLASLSMMTGCEEVLVVNFEGNSTCVENQPDAEAAG